jgi:hypothetical protein
VQISSDDSFEKELEGKTEELKECQSKLEVDSCLKCDKILECQLRKEYVKVVYMSMNKGDSGGFEF